MLLLLLLLFILLRHSTCFADVEAPSRRWVEIGSQVSTVTASWFGWIAAGESTADRMIVELFLWTEKAGRPAGGLGRAHTMHAAARALEQRKACRPIPQKKMNSDSEGRVRARCAVRAGLRPIAHMPRADRVGTAATSRTKGRG